MTPEEVAAFYDDPANAAMMCNSLMRARPGWEVWRYNRIWQARRTDWPRMYPPLAIATAGMLNLVMWSIDEGDAA
ncbi:hypothetical protein AB0L53_54815 [Nonomuraea sp. NPDC052129]|uniref:hypothetical protein n=1 Tax=Nonomuraea sp. NPDC052129 TaxID=3154651 RepID=UPI00342E03B0